MARYAVLVEERTRVGGACLQTSGGNSGDDKNPFCPHEGTHNQGMSWRRSHAMSSGVSWERFTSRRKMKSKLLFLIVVASSSAIYAQNPLSSAVKQNYNNIKGTLIKGADKMSEADYTFKPAPESRTYGAVVTHIAAVQGLICASAKGEDKKFDDSKTGKADAVALLKAAFDYCDPIYDALTDANGLEMGKMFGRDTPKFNILNFGVIHDNEMYGTMAVYLRAKGLVPPSSEPRGPAKK
jgi:DinB superfamily